MVHEFSNWPRNPTNDFTLKNCLFGTIKLKRNVEKGTFTYNGIGIAFDGKGHWSFDIETARNVVIFGADDSSSSHFFNPKITF